MKLVVGLGNIGDEYKNTRHNIGFMVLDYFPGNKVWKEKMLGEYWQTVIDGEKVIFLKPKTYVNLSGNCVSQYVNYFDIQMEDILIIQDDMDLPFGKYKLKKNSSSGGHNGLKSIISSLHSEAFSRLKVGIAHDRSMDTKDYVLGKFSKAQLAVINEMLPKYCEIVHSFIVNGIDKTMNNYNSK